MEICYFCDIASGKELTAVSSLDALSSSGESLFRKRSYMLQTPSQHVSKRNELQDYTSCQSRLTAR